MASDEEEDDEGWGNYRVNDTDDEEEEAPLSEEAERRRQEERKTWAPRRSKPQPRTQRPLSFSERNKLRRAEEKKAQSESPVLVELPLTASSSSSSSSRNKKKTKVNSSAQNRESSSSSSSSSSDDVVEAPFEEDDSVRTEEMGGDPLYLVYDDVSPKKLWLGKDSTNPYLRSVKEWVRFNEGHVLDAFNSAQGSRADTIAEVFRPIRCVPLSDVLKDKERYPHLMVPLRTVFVAFAFYNSEVKDLSAGDGAVMHPDTIREIQELPLTIMPNMAIPRATRLFRTICVTLIRGHGRFRVRDVFREVAKWMPAAKRSVRYPSTFLSVWDRRYAFFFAVDRTELPGVNTHLWRFLETVYSSGLFDEQWLHAPALLQHMLQLGLLPEPRTKRIRNDDGDSDLEVDVTGGAWTHFLTRGLYDPRLFLYISAFITDKQEVGLDNAMIRRLVQEEWIEEPFFDAHRDRNAEIFEEYWNVYYDRE